MQGEHERTRLERLAVDVDTRLTELWLVALEPGSPIAEAIEADEGLRDSLGHALRVAYGRGYIDALTEDRAGRRAELHRTHGYQPE